jgi:hypothetical protein
MKRSGGTRSGAEPVEIEARRGIELSTARRLDVSTRRGREMGSVVPRRNGTQGALSCGGRVEGARRETRGETRGDTRGKSMRTVAGEGAAHRRNARRRLLRSYARRQGRGRLPRPHVEKERGAQCRARQGPRPPWRTASMLLQASWCESSQIRHRGNLDAF